MKILKKFIAFGMAISTIGTFTNITNVIHAAQTSIGYFNGDIDNNGYVDISDLSLLNLFLTGSNTTAHNRMTERLDVNRDNIIDYRDSNMISAYINHQISTNIYFYSNYSDLIEEANGLYYTMVNLTGETLSSSTYWLRSVSPISETTSSIQSLNIRNELNTASTSASNGIIKLTVNIGNETIVGTGFIVDDNTILTAASNLCRKSGNTWQYASEVNCDLYTKSGTYINGGYSADYYHIPLQYTSASDNAKYNYAAIKLGDNVNLSNYKVNLGIPTISFDNSVMVTNVNTNGNVITSTNTYNLYGQKVYGEFINYEASYGAMSTQYGAPLYIENNNSQITVLGIVCKYVDGIVPFNRAVRIDQDIFRFVYNNAFL